MEESVTPDHPEIEKEEDRGESLPETITVLISDWQRLHNEVKEFKEKYLHALAEGENSRKRLQKERQEMIQHAIQKVIVEFLNPIDQLESALKYAQEASPEVKNWAIGFGMISNQFKEVLHGHGVTPFVSLGQPFDPNYHEAVGIVESGDHPPDTVVKEHVRGYTLGGQRLLRPARVDVSKEKKEEE